MSSTVLGKRTRSSLDNEVATCPRAKRQARTIVYNDENECPSSKRRTRSKINYDDSMDIDELADTVTTKSSPAKHGKSRIILEPAKTKTQIQRSDILADENLNPIQVLTPQTPRHRDALSKKAPFTPRHRVTIPGKAFTPQTPRTPSSSGNVTTIYNSARLLFTRSSDPGRLVGREDERKELSHFMTSCIEKNVGGCTYVSGPPGTGKSAMVNEVIRDLGDNSSVKTVYINCMSMKTSKDIYITLLDNLCEGIEIMEGEEEGTLQGIFIPRKKSDTIYVITLDEIDHVLSLDLDFMYKLFEWSLQKSSKLVLMGIANALDLTDRFLPRLKARNLKPNLLPFLPYSAAQIKAVITTRLKSLNPSGSATPDYIPFVHPAAIELCSRKVAGQTGDLRKAMDICRRAIDLIENETKMKHQQTITEQLQSSPTRKVLGENTNLSSPAASPSKLTQQMSLARSLSTLTVETAPRASIAHVNKITSSTFGNGTNQRLKTLNLQQKAALCSLVALEKRKRAAAASIMATPSKSANAAPTVKALYDNYCKLCKRDAVLQPLTSTEFRDVIGSLETLSLISGVDGKNGSFVGFGTPSKRGRAGFGGGVGSGDEKRVGSCVSEKELEQAVEGLGAAILKSILSGEGLDY